MEKDIQEKIALKRYQIISPVLAEPARAQNEYFRKQARREHDFPRYGLRKVSVSTMKAWLRAYRKNGFEGLKPKERSDNGRPKRLDEQAIKAIEIKCKAYPYWTVQKLYENLRDQDLLGHPPVHYNTLLRMVKERGFLTVKARTDVRKAYEVDNVNDLWVCDFMHGPLVKSGHHGKRAKKAILCAILDDHSRMVDRTCLQRLGDHQRPDPRPQRGLSHATGYPKDSMSITGPVSLPSSWPEAAPWPASPLSTQNLMTVHRAEKWKDSSGPSGNAFSPASRKASPFRNSMRPSGCGSRRTTTISSTPASEKGPLIDTMPPLKGYPSADFPRTELDEIFLIRHERRGQ